ncbi:hypothetical protein [Okeania sp. SIO2C2]|uniref:hypothetical protein n=1 Tax=Okeania sp. SIO2C2 TaxID=2607787 RepID=UPI00257D880A|nr:hypothetical protein [Okeania sp. SIO2C2]
MSVRQLDWDFWPKLYYKHQKQYLYQIRLNSHRMVKLGGVRSQSDLLRRRKNYKDKRSYGD